MLLNKFLRFVTPVGEKRETKDIKQTKILKEYKALRQQLEIQATKTPQEEPLVSILYTPPSILKESHYTDEEGDVFFDALSSSGLFTEQSPPPTETQPDLFHKYLQDTSSTRVRFSSTDIIVPIGLDEPPMSTDLTHEMLNKYIKYYSELTINPDGNIKHPALRSSDVKFDSYLEIVEYNETDYPMVVSDSTPNPDIKRARKLIKSAHSVMFKEIKLRLEQMRKFIEETQSRTGASETINGGKPSFKPDNFSDYLRSCNTLSEVMSNMLVLTRDSLRLLLSVRLYTLTPADKRMIEARINELETITRFDEVGKPDTKGGLLSSALNYFITTGEKLTEINRGCMEIFDKMLKIYGPVDAGRTKRENEIKYLVFELLEQNLALFNLHSEMYRIHLESVLSLHSLFNRYITNLTSAHSVETTAVEQAQFGFRFPNSKSLSEMGGLDKLLSEISTQEKTVGTSLLPLTPAQIDLLKTVEERRDALSGPKNTFSKTPSITEIDGPLGLLLFMLKITLIFVVVIFRYIQIIWIVPFDRKTYQFKIIDNNEEYFKLRKIKGDMDTLVSVIEASQHSTTVYFEEIMEKIKGEGIFEIHSIAHARYVPASGGARKLTKKRRKKSGKTKNRRKRNQTLRRKKSKSKSKHSRRKRKQLRK